MNKDVIYIEPEDDITDIVTKIENSKEQIVAIVPPKKADILHSSINIKLMDKAGKNADKKLVLVTEDAVIIKHAASVKMPITKDLQSAPAIPTLEDADEEAAFDELNNKKSTTKTSSDAEKDINDIDSEENKEETKTSEEDKEEAVTEESSDKKEDTESSDKSEDKKLKKKNKKSKGNSNNWFIQHRKWFFIGGPIAGVLVLVIVWAFVIAPAVEIKIKVRTKVEKFSENVNFTTNLEAENLDSSTFYLEGKKVENKNTVKFNATGTKNVGEKAKGNIIVYAYFKESGRIAINANSSFTSEGHTFYSDTDVELGYDKSKGSVAECSNRDDGFSLLNDGCLVLTRLNVTAAAPGSEYNIAQNNAWTTAANVGVYSDSNMTGGTDRTITVVQQSDIDNAKTDLTNPSKEEETKNQLFEQITEDHLKIDSSYNLTTSDLVSSPAVGEEVAEGVEPTLTATTTAKIFVIDLTKIRAFITAQAKIPEKEHIYAIGNPFIENFTATESGYTGRLKTNYTYGAKLSEQSVIELVKGQRLGNVNPILKDEGASEVEINRSYPWVTSVPNDVNKITVTIKEE